MNVFIAGGGRVGAHLALLLSAENHDITVLDSNPDRLEQLDYSLDVRTLHGNAASALFLADQGAGQADLFVAVTGHDEVNLLSATSAKALGAKQTVARVDANDFLQSHMLYEAMLGIDYVLSPEALAAREIATYVESAGIVAAEQFGHGRVQMRQVRVGDSPALQGKPLRDVCPPGSGALLAMVSRGGEVEIPRGDTIVRAGDLVTFVGSPQKVDAMLKLFRGEERKSAHIIVMGGGSVGFHLAQALETKGRFVKLFERKMSRCQELSEALVKTIVVCRDGTSREDLIQEQVDQADLFVAATNDDEQNIMASVLAKELGAEQTIAVVHEPDFAPLVSRLGIDHAVTPRASIANRILKLVHQDKTTSLAVLEEGTVEIVEVKAQDGAPVVGRQLKDVRLPEGVLVASIMRGNDVIVPSGQDEIRTGDAVVVIANSDALEAAMKLFEQ